MRSVMPFSPSRMADLPLVSVVLPTYNEAGNIVDLAKEIHARVRQPLEIIVVDDNSPDGTSKLVADLVATGTIPGLRIETRLTDRGLTKSIQHGIDVAKGDIIVWLDCDFSMPPAIISQLLAKIDEGYDIAVGSRFVDGGQFKNSDRWFGGEESRAVILLSRMLNWFLRHALFPSFRDYTSGFIAIRKPILTNIRLSGNYGEYFIDLMYRAMLGGAKVIEIPYVNLPRRAGESKTGADVFTLVRLGLPYLGKIVQLRLLPRQKRA